MVKNQQEKETSQEKEVFKSKKKIKKPDPGLYPDDINDNSFLMQALDLQDIMKKNNPSKST
ncbi:MAG: hypothetical protein WDK96_03910 [Candidatus Paceibacterota bacterium]|jgi:hypothetical protein